MTSGDQGEILCGDGIVNNDEECDEGGFNGNDDCTVDCKYVRRIVFVSSTLYNGDLGGFLGADEKCQLLAASINFKAWLSTSVHGPVDRFDTDFEGMYVLSGVEPCIVLAHGWSGLTSGELYNPINIDESGEVVQDSTVWTNTNSDGTPEYISNCDEWMTGASEYVGALGFTSEKDSNWTDSGAAAECNNQRRIYCFEDPM